ncbi:hypothetical protein ACTGZM_11195, partial [Streptococcus suis]
STTTLFTTAHLTIVAIFAIVVILGLIWGARLKHRRRQAEREIEARNAEVAEAPAATRKVGEDVREAPAPTPVPTAPVAPPVAPPPPPLAPAAP